MSVQKRKISYWSIDFISKDEHFFDAELFCRFMIYLKNLDQKSLISRDEDQNKAFSVASINEVKKQGKTIIEFAFKSCKYNHSPNYMSSIDGVERDSAKKLFEGEKELTHLCFRIDEKEAYTIFEERRNGVAMGAAVNYLNLQLEKFLKSEGREDTFTICANIIPAEDFLDALGKTQTISSVELFAEKTILGSEYWGLIKDEINSRDDITICIKSKPRTSLLKRTAENAFLSIATEGTAVKRIRVQGKDINKIDVTLDSLNGKKVDEITVKLQSNGVVDSRSIFSIMEELIEVAE